MLPYKPPAKKGAQVSNKLDESKYFEAIARCKPDLYRAEKLRKDKLLLNQKFKAMKEENQT